MYNLLTKVKYNQWAICLAFAGKEIKMGLFTPNYNKPGPGIDKNAPEKRRIWQFFEIFWGQLSKLSLLNIMYLIASLPLILGLWLCFTIDFTTASIITLRIPNQIDLIGLILLVISLFVTFPATLGFTYVLRNIQRREHAWLWHDFMKHTRLNYWKGVVNGLVTLVIYFLLINAFGMYRSGVFNLGVVGAYLSVMMVVAILIFTWMQFYVNTMIVTFDLKLGAIYKNAFIFAMGKLPLNLFITIVSIALAIGIMLIPMPFITIVLVFTVLFSLFGYITVFSVYPTIDKYMISKSESASEENDESIDVIEE